MADISKMTLPNGTTYNIKDETAREALDGKTAVDIMNMECSWGYRTGIPSGSNLNNYTTAGKFAVSDNSVAASVTGSPFTDTGYFIDVFRRSSTLQVQIAISWDGVIKIRRCSSSGWSEWQKVVTDAELAALEARISALENGG